MMCQQRCQQEGWRLSDLIQEDLSGISAIKIYGQEATGATGLRRRNGVYRDAPGHPPAAPCFRCWKDFLDQPAAAAGPGQWPAESGRLSIGDLVALILYVERLVFPTALLGFTLNTFQTGQVSLERVEQPLARPWCSRPASRSQRQPRRGELEAGPHRAHPGAARPAPVDVTFRTNPANWWRWWARWLRQDHSARALAAWWSRPGRTLPRRHRCDPDGP